MISTRASTFDQSVAEDESTTQHHIWAQGRRKRELEATCMAGMAANCLRVGLWETCCVYWKARRVDWTLLLSDIMSLWPYNDPFPVLLFRLAVSLFNLSSIS